MNRYPSLSSYLVSISRPIVGVDDEGTPLTTYENVFEFRGGFGSTSSSREQVLGADGQRVDAAISTRVTVDVHINDKAVVAGREWRVVGVVPTGLTTRILLAVWGNK